MWGPQKSEKCFGQRIPVSRKNFFRLTGILVFEKFDFCALRIPVSRKKFFRLTGLPAPPEICNRPGGGAVDVIILGDIPAPHAFGAPERCTCSLDGSYASSPTFMVEF